MLISFRIPSIYRLKTNMIILHKKFWYAWFFLGGIVISSFVLDGCAIKKTTGEEELSADRRMEDVRFGKVDPRFLGIWGSTESSARFRIGAVNHRYKIEAWDGEDGERFKVSKIKWTETQLQAVIEMPSTTYNIQIDLTIIDQNQLQCIYSGDRFGKSIWRRMASDEL